MKKRKFSLLLNIATIALCVCAIAIGVYSAKKASLTVSGSIGFEAHNCKVKVLGKLEGAHIKATQGSDVLTSQTKYFNSTCDADGESVAVYEGGEHNSWAIGDVYFNDLDCSNDEIATPMVFTFTLENLSVYSVVASIVIPATIGSVVDLVGPTFKTSGYTDGEYGFVLPKSTDGESGTTVELSISLTPKSHTDIIALSLEEMQITFDKAVEVNVTATSTANKYEYDQLSFKVDTETNRAEVRPINPTSISGDVVIPSVIIYNNQEYIVSTLGMWYTGQGNTNLTSLVIPNNITNFVYLASYTALKTLTLPNNLKSIGSNTAFIFGCTSLTTISIPKSVTRIVGGAFAGSCLTSITIPKGVTEIGPTAFKNCTSLQEVKIPSSVVRLCFDAAVASVFAGTPFLTNLQTNSNGIYTCYDDSTKKILISAPKDISSIDLTGFIAMDVGALSGCTNLTNVTIPETVQILEGALFDGCTNLKSVTIPKSIKVFLPFTFRNCSNLETINYNGTQAEWNAITKNNDWNSGMGSSVTGGTKVVCSDGTITFS